MTQTFGTNSENDIYLGATGNLVILDGIDAVSAACATAAKAQLGEMCLAINQGMPDFQTVFKGTPNYPLFASYLRTTLQSVAGVIKVVDIIMASRDNILSYTATIETSFGRAVISG